MNPRWILRRAAARVRRAPVFFCLLTLAFAVTGALVATARTLGAQSARAAARLGESSHIVAYLEPGLGADRAAALAVAFGRLPGVARVRELDGQAALAELGRTLAEVGRKGDVLADIEADFLPRSIEISLATGGDLGGRAREVAARLGRLEGVSAVDAMTDGMARMAGFGVLTGRLADLFAGVAALFGFALVGGLVLRERNQHRELGETLHLVGAAPLSMWLPIGLGDAVAAVLGGGVGLWVGVRLTTVVMGGALVGPGLEDAHTLAAALGLGLPLPRLALVVGAALAAFGLAIGWLSLPRPRGLEVR